jgi:hypothetical protein
MSPSTPYWAPVLAVKGSLHRAKYRRALDRSAPFRPDNDRDGRLRRERDTLYGKTKTQNQDLGT